MTNFTAVSTPTLATTTATIDTTSALFQENDGQSQLEEKDSSNLEAVIAAVIGTILTATVILIISLGVRLRRKKQKTGSFPTLYEANTTSNTNADDKANQNVGDSTDFTNDEMVINEIYVASDKSNDICVAADENNDIYVAAEENNCICAAVDEQNNVHSATNGSNKIFMAANEDNLNKKTTV